MTRLNATRSSRLLAKAITPALLVVGLLALLVYHFSGTLANLQKQQDAYNGVIGLSSGHLSIVLHRDSANGRPTVSFNGESLVDYIDTRSAISLDGQSQNLWAGDHGYSTDVGKRQIFSTASGSGWQVIEVTALKDINTVAVTYYFVSLPRHGTGPHQAVLLIQHSHRVWMTPKVTGTMFAATVLPEPAPISNSQVVLPEGLLSVAVSGPHAKASAVAIDDNDLRISTGASWATGFSTAYEIDDPSPGALLLLGTETIHFQATPRDQATPVPFPLSPA